MRWHKGRSRQTDDLITASEVASFAYCPEQWRLQYGLVSRDTNLYEVRGHQLVRAQPLAPDRPELLLCLP
jgi:hypothetical protein